MQPDSVRHMIIRSRDTTDFGKKQSEIQDERIIFGNGYSSFIKFIILQRVCYLWLSDVIIYHFKSWKALILLNKFTKSVLSLSVMRHCLLVG